jgi:hypothetical protein
MSWIDDRLEQREALAERNKLIDENADAIYYALWKEIVGFIEEAVTKGLRVSTNGAVQRRYIVLEAPLGLGQQRLELTMESKRTISAAGGSLNLKFDLDVCTDSVVCLKQQGHQISERETAMLILDQFLFPDLAEVPLPSVYKYRGGRAL